MKIIFSLAVLAQLGFGHRVRGGKGILDSIDTGDDKPTEKPFVYLPSNTKTQVPKTFEDEIVEDRSYHDLVPSLTILKDMLSGK